MVNENKPACSAAPIPSKKYDAAQADDEKAEAYYLSLYNEDIEGSLDIQEKEKKENE